MTTTTTELLRRTITAFLQENREKNISIRVIKHHIAGAHEGLTYTEGMLSGALRDIVAGSAGRITNPSRGFYRYNPNAKQEELIRVLNQTKADVEQLAVGNVLTFTDEDLDTIRRIPDVLAKIDSIVHSFAVVEEPEDEDDIDEPYDEEDMKYEPSGPDLFDLFRPEIEHVEKLKREYLHKKLEYRRVSYYVKYVEWDGKSVKFVLEQENGETMTVTENTIKRFNIKGD